MATTHNLLREWCRGIRHRQQTADWSTHVFREHNKEDDLWGDKGAKGRVEEWVDGSFGSTGLVSNLQEMRAASGHQLLGCRAGGEVWYAGG